MLPVSQLFQQKINSDQRTLKAVLEIVFNNNPNLLQATAQASSYYDNTTKPEQVCNGRIRPSYYSALSGLPSYLSYPHKGWWSASHSDANGNVNEALTVTYPQQVYVRTVWFVAERGYFPTDFSIDLRVASGWQTILTVTDNNSHVWVNHLDNALWASGVRIRISKIATPNNPVKIYQFGVPYRLCLDDDDFEDMQILEEVTSQSGVPLGNVTSNELNVSVRNDHRWLTPSNEDSPFKYDLKPGVKLYPYIGLEILPNQFEFVPMGKFISSDWTMPEQSVFASITGYDRLYELAQQPMPKIPVVTNTTIKGLLETIFLAYGLSPSDFIIDETLTQPIQMGWLPRENFFDAMGIISEAGNCAITTDRYNRIIVINNFQEPEPIADITSDKDVFELTNPHSYLSIYSGVKVGYKVPVESEIKQVLSVTGLEVQAGVTTLKNIPFSQGPVIRLEYYRIKQSSNIKILSIINDAWTCDIEVQNLSGSPKKIDIEAYGLTVETLDVEFTLRDSEAVNMIGERLYEVNNPLIQSDYVAKLYARSLLQYLKQPNATFKGRIRGNPALELFDIVKADNIAANMKDIIICPTRLEYHYDGGLEVTIEGRKPIIPTIPVYVTPNLVVIAPLKRRISY